LEYLRAVEVVDQGVGIWRFPTVGTKTHFGAIIIVCVTARVMTDHEHEF
jgi:hypothetical protein